MQLRIAKVWTCVDYNKRKVIQTAANLMFEFQEVNSRNG